jgi:hypothetical protein
MGLISNISSGVNSAVNTITKPIQTVGSKILQADIDFIKNIPLQHKCKFEIVIYNDAELDGDYTVKEISQANDGTSQTNKTTNEEPSKGLGKLFKNVGDTIKNNAGNINKGIDVAQSNWVFRYYLYDIQGINIDGIEFKRIRGKQYAQDLVYTDTVTAQFFDDSYGTMKNFFRKWQNLVRTYDDDIKEYVFEDNQAAAKRTAMIIPNSKANVPSEEWIMLRGMRPQSIESLGYEHSNGEYELISVSFAVDSVRLYNLIPDFDANAIGKAVSGLGNKISSYFK